ncbi:hypothetical protein [Myceligenerans pegani]|uniref:Replicase polyprotein 1ab n=1 Tax=Myceligenerans pegani TaxID=2776917 RepID=A0ABR9N4C6_9MICO|nr:hypothetical protein [Myceligenerans sp. TRM 65318]MBE1878525.1 hypothetical protein [Myceligenerans sp. TRM 65318]MBE3020796.1 hypothetical protein [Myceligenerans sp. TRM 65318]
MEIGQLDREARARMRGLGKDNAERVGLHLIMAGRLIDVDPETAYLHAQAAVRRAGRIDVVREAAGLTAYRTGRFAEALRELRTVRRLNGSSEHLPLMADAERGLGRPERAIALAATPEAETLDASGRTELAIVVSGARSDLGEHDAALAVLDKIPADEAQGDLGLRVLQARAVALEAAGRPDEAAAVLADVDPEALARATGAEPPEEDVVVYDVYDEEADLEEAAVLDDGADEPAVDEEAAADSTDLDTADEGLLDEDTAVGDVTDELAVDEDAVEDAGDLDGTDEGLLDEEAAGEEPATADETADRQERETEGALPAAGATSAGSAAGSEPAPGAGVIAGEEGDVVDIPDDAPEPSEAEIEAEVAEILAEAGIDDETDGADEATGVVPEPAEPRDAPAGEAGTTRGPVA